MHTYACTHKETWQTLHGWGVCFSVLITICNRTLREINKTKNKKQKHAETWIHHQRNNESTHSPGFFFLSGFGKGKSKENRSAKSFLNLKSISKASLPFSLQRTNVFRLLKRLENDCYVSVIWRSTGDGKERYFNKLGCF